MMRKNWVILTIIVLHSFLQKGFGQEDYVVNQAKFLQKSNASFLGMNQLNRVGVLYNSLRVNESTAMDNKYAFGSIAFQDKNFSLGFDINSFRLNDTGLISSLVNFSYIYKIQISNYTYFLPSVSLGLGSSRVNVENLVFGDQLNMATGFISTESIDPLAPQISSVNYFDLGASFIIHNELYMVGLSLKHLNKPNVSYNKETPYAKPISIGVQAGYEFNINPFERGFLPRFSYLYTFLNLNKYGDSTYIGLAEEFQLGEFSIGFTQQAASVNSFALNNFGLTMGLALENFDFGIHYNFPNRKPGTVYSPSIFELSIIFDFSIYRRNNRGLYKKLQIDNYY
jgi:type IX secretion system PorP/SprF family membrane protein